MATNGPNGNTPNGNINFNSNPNVEPGILGYVQGQNTKKQFTNDFWKEGGYLSESIKELEEMKRQYKEMSKEVSNLSKAEQKNFTERKQALNQQLALLKTIKENQEASDTEAIDAINSSNKLRLKGQQDLIKLLNSIIENQDKADQEHLDNLDAAVEKYNQIKQSTDETGEKLKQTAKVLNKASDSWSDSLSKTLDKAGNKLSELSNMFNLQSIANNAAEQNARSKAAIMGDVSRQFGFTSNSQFESFKNSLNDTLKDMNSNMDNLFNAEDMKNYMANLSTYGITDPKMAEQQMKSSILATKYLGSSTETQTMIFKYMKQTNNNKALEEQNQRIVGILKSQLGVSKEQLDELSKQSYTDAEALLALGKNDETINKYLDESMTVKSALEAINPVYGTAMGQLFNEIISTPYNKMLEKFGPIFGNDTDTIYNYLTSGDAIEAAKLILSSPQLNNILSMGANSDRQEEIQSIVQDELGVKSLGGLTNMYRYFSSNGFDELNDNIDKVLDGVLTTTNEDVDSYIEQTQEATYLEQIQNVLSTWINGLPWKSTMNLANLAFTAYLASGAVKLFGSISKFIGGFANGGGLKGGLTALLGGSAGGGSTAVGAGMSSFLAGGIAVGLTTAAVAAISSAMTAARHENSEFYSNEWEEKLSNSSNSTDKALSTNKAFTSALGQAEANKEGNWFSRDMDNLGTGLSLMWSKMTGANYVEKNKKFWDWLAASSISKKASTAEFTSYAMAYQFLLDEVGSLASWEGATQEDLKQYVKTGLVDKANIKSYINHLVEEGWTPSDRYGNKATGNINWDKYAMNGVDWVPRDNYLINAHKGEMLLTADEAKAYRSMLMPKNAGEAREGFYSVDDGRRGGSYPYPITSAYGEARDGGRTHTGVDFGISQGTPIGASAPGKVTFAAYDSGGYGNLVKILGNNGKYMLYAHQSKLAVKSGQQVNAGSLIGYVGNTGHSTGPHLHFEVRKTADYGTDIDPLPYVTNSLFNIGDTSGTVLSSSTDNFNNAKESDGTVQVRTRRFVPKAFTGNMGGDDGPERIVNSVDGGFNKLISYLDSIRDEQAKQRALLNAFSKSRIPESTF